VSEPRIALSVVMPCLDAAETIGVELEALARQRWEGAWELVVADNGSSDATLEVVERYRNRVPELRVVHAGGARSPAHALNAGARAARGELLLFCDADDEVGDGWLAALADALREHELVTPRRDHMRLNERWVRESRDPPPPDGIHRNWYPPYLPHAATGGLGMRRSLYEALGGFDESFQVCEDNDFCFRAQLHGATLHAVPEAVYHYRLRDTIPSIYRQARAYAEWNAGIQRKFRPAGTRIDRRWI
jgi:glycosyltransferase involved in cell wall biosynthesis